MREKIAAFLRHCPACDGTGRSQWMVSLLVWTFWLQAWLWVLFELIPRLWN